MQCMHESTRPVSPPSAIVCLKVDYFEVIFWVRVRELPIRFCAVVFFEVVSVKRELDSDINVKLVN